MPDSPENDPLDPDDESQPGHSLDLPDGEPEGDDAGVHVTIPRFDVPRLPPEFWSSLRAAQAVVWNPNLQAAIRAAQAAVWNPDLRASMRAAITLPPKTLASIRESIAPQLAQMRQSMAAAVAADFSRLVLPKFEWSPEFLDAVKTIKALAPPNWPAGMDYDHLEAVFDDGLPLVWVPRASTVSAVLAAPDREARMQVLVANRQEIIEDCRDVIRTTTSREYAAELDLASKAVDALALGADEAAQALAVVVLDTSTNKAISDNHNQVKDRVKVDPDDLTLVEFRLFAALAPLHEFLTPWTPGKTPGPRPTALSRHVSVHGACPEHYTEGNAILSVLLMTSVLRAYQELEEARAAFDNPAWPWRKK